MPFCDLTYGTQQVSCRSDTRREVAEHRFFAVPSVELACRSDLCILGRCSSIAYKFDSNLLAIQ